MFYHHRYRYRYRKVSVSFSSIGIGIGIVKIQKVYSPRLMLYILNKYITQFSRNLSIMIDQCNGIHILAKFSNNSPNFRAIKMRKIIVD